MPKEIESGIYTLRIKYTNQKDELEVSYERHSVHTGITDMKEILHRVTETHRKFAKGEIVITHRYTSPIRSFENE